MSYSGFDIFMGLPCHATTTHIDSGSDLIEFDCAINYEWILMLVIVTSHVMNLFVVAVTCANLKTKQLISYMPAQSASLIDFSSFQLSIDYHYYPQHNTLFHFILLVFIYCIFEWNSGGFRYKVREKEMGSFLLHTLSNHNLTTWYNLLQLQQLFYQRSSTYSNNHNRDTCVKV